jgi:hypothetical protein
MLTLRRLGAHPTAILIASQFDHLARHKSVVEGKRRRNAWHNPECLSLFEPDRRRTANAAVDRWEPRPRVTKIR